MLKFFLLTYSRSIFKCHSLHSTHLVLPGLIKGFLFVLKNRLPFSCRLSSTAFYSVSRYSRRNAGIHELISIVDTYIYKRIFYVWILNSLKSVLFAHMILSCSESSQCYREYPRDDLAQVVILVQTIQVSVLCRILLWILMLICCLVFILCGKRLSNKIIIFHLLKVLLRICF